MAKNIGKFLNNTARTIRGATSVANSAKRAGKTVQNMAGKKKADEKDGEKAKDDASWVCACGTTSTSKFCGECDKERPSKTICSCGWERPPENSSMKFCGECGAKFE